MKNHTTKIHILVGLLCLTQFTFQTGCARDERLFTDPIVYTERSAPGETFFTDLPSSLEFESITKRFRTGIREKLVGFDAEKFQTFVKQSSSSSTMTIELFDGQAIEIQVDKPAQGANTDEVKLTGRVGDDPKSKVEMTFKADKLVGEIRMGRSKDKIQIRPLGQGAHVLRLTENEPEPVKIEPGFPVVDILVAYTPNATRLVGSAEKMQALIQRALSDANHALEESGANFRVQLVGSMQTRQNESGRMWSDLNALAGKYDGLFDEVHEQRKLINADQVTLIGAFRQTGSVTGIAYLNSRPDNAMAVLKVAGIKQYTLIHELGHNLGLNHSDGFKNSKGRFRTIMAYGGLRRICRFSNPQLSFNGYSTGDRHHNEVAIINRTGPLMAKFL